MNYLNNVTIFVMIVNTNFVITNEDRHDTKYKSFMIGQR